MSVTLVAIVGPLLVVVVTHVLQTRRLRQENTRQHDEGRHRVESLDAKVGTVVTSLGRLEGKVDYLVAGQRHQDHRLDDLEVGQERQQADLRVVRDEVTP